LGASRSSAAPARRTRPALPYGGAAAAHRVYLAPGSGGVSTLEWGRRGSRNREFHSKTVARRAHRTPNSATAGLPNSLKIVAARLITRGLGERRCAQQARKPPAAPVRCQSRDIQPRRFEAPVALSHSTTASLDSAIAAAIQWPSDRTRRLAQRPLLCGPRPSVRNYTTQADQRTTGQEPRPRHEVLSGLG